MRNGDDMTDRDRKQQATAPSRSRSVVRAMIWATVPVLLVVQLLASAGVEASSFWSQIRQLDARIARTAESRAELIAEPLWKMRYDQVTSVLNEIMHDETIAAAAVYDDTGVAIARVVARPADQAVSEVSRPIRYSNGNIAVQAGRIAIAYSYATVYTDTGSRLIGVSSGATADAGHDVHDHLEAAEPECHLRKRSQADEGRLPEPCSSGCDGGAIGGLARAEYGFAPLSPYLAVRCQIH